MQANIIVNNKELGSCKDIIWHGQRWMGQLWYYYNNIMNRNIFLDEHYLLYYMRFFVILHKKIDK